jgi:hypothetical protein
MTDASSGLRPSDIPRTAAETRNTKTRKRGQRGCSKVRAQLAARNRWFRVRPDHHGRSREW